MQAPDAHLIKHYSHQLLYGNTKIERNEARQNLLHMTRNFTTDFDIGDNSYWNTIKEVVKYFKETGKFAFAIDTEKYGRFLKKFREVKGATPKGGSAPAYVAIMPHCPKKTPNQLNEQVSLLNQEGFGTDPLLSEEEAFERLRIVVGINRCHSLNPEDNRAFRTYVRSIRRYYQNFDICSFYWAPEWIVVKPGVFNLGHRAIQRMFKILLALDPQKAARLARSVQANVPVPHQRVREYILKHPFVKDNCIAFRHGNAQRPLWLYCCDDDAKHYKRMEDGPGIFSVYDDLQHAHPRMEVGTTGYVMEDPDNDFVFIETTVDLYARREIGRERPNGVMYAEPNLLIKVLGDVSAGLGRLSFIRKTEPGGPLESLGIIENLGLSKGNVVGRLVTGMSGEIETSLPARFKISEQNMGRICLYHILLWDRLKGLHSGGQSSIRPLKGFGMNLARSLPGNKASAKIQGLLAKILSIYDIVSYAEGLGTYWYHCYAAARAEIESIYEARRSGVANPNYRLRAENILSDLKYPPDGLHARMETFLEVQVDLYIDTLTKMRQTNLTENDIQAVITAARAAGDGMLNAIVDMFFSTNEP